MKIIKKDWRYEIKKSLFSILITIIVILVVITIYFVLGMKFSDASDITKQFEEALYENPEYYDKFKNTPLNYSECTKLFFKDNYYTENFVMSDTDYKTLRDNINVKVYNIRSFHGFFYGYVWLTYNKECYKDGNLISGSLRVPVTLKIKKINGKWEIIDKYEEI